jgi:hypothetical protein
MDKAKFGLKSLVLLLAIVICNSRASAVPTVSLQPSTTTPTVGGSFNVLVNISAVTDLYGYQFDIQYNPSILSAASVTEGPFLAAGGATFFIPGAINNIGGTITFTSDVLISALAGVAGSGSLATLNFSALAKGTSALVLSNVELLDSNLDDIAFVTSGANVNPVSGNTIPEANSGVLVSFGILGMVILRKVRGRFVY